MHIQTMTAKQVYELRQAEILVRLGRWFFVDDVEPDGPKGSEYCFSGWWFSDMIDNKGYFGLIKEVFTSEDEEMEVINGVEDINRLRPLIAS